MRIVFLILFLQITSAYAGDYVVVVSKNSQVDSMDTSKVRDVFLKKRSFEGNKKMIPVNLIGDQQVRKVFEENILNMKRDELNRYWVQNHFQGISPPVTQASLLSLKRFVEKVDGAIGYLPVEMVDGEVKIVNEF